MRVSRRQASRWAELAKAPGTSIPKPRRRAKAPRATLPEKDLQAMAENLCIALGIRFFRLPDSLLGYLARCPDAWIRVFVSRYLAGLPDMLLFRPRPEGDNVVRMIEIKTEAGKLSQGQEKFHAGLNVHICFGWAETENAIRGFLAEGPASPPEQSLPTPPPPKDPP